MNRVCSLQHLFTETLKYACGILEKEAVVQLAKQLNLFRVREESSSCLCNLERSMWELSIQPPPARMRARARCNVA